MKKFLKEISSYVIIIIVVVLFRTFIATPASVDGDSMDSTLKDHDLVIINKLIMSIKNLERYDIIVLKNEKDKDKIIKRIIGLPNETIEYKDNILYINDKVAEIPPNLKFEETFDFEAKTGNNEYFVLGDNRDISKDSRYLGNFTKDEIIGLVDFRFYPFDKIGIIN